MIVEPDFPDHWKTQLLIQLTGEPAAPMLVIRLWAHCQQRKAWRFTSTDMPDEALAAVCRWTGEPKRLREHLTAARFLDRGEDGEIVVHQWDEVNATLVRNWGNGAKNALRFKPSGNPSDTHMTPTGGAIEKIDKIDRSREDREEKKTPLTPPGKGSRRKKKALAGSTTADAQEEPRRGRMLALNAIFRRVPTDLWSADDVEALEASGLLAMQELDFVDACETVRAFYHAEIPHEMAGQFWKRTTLLTLLRHWGGELDKARLWARKRDDGVKRT